MKRTALLPLVLIGLIGIGCRGPKAPELISPSYGEEIASTRVELVWEAVPGAKGYYVQVSENILFNGFFVERVESSPYPFVVLTSADLDAGTTYYWRVYAEDEHHYWSEPSGTRSFDY
ncbi:MAG: fibronectin type III domain-containing protein [Candidatus Stahlbacteria bacterium]|nr:MAG: fibronectin type III domain-containing protein [Candidatus Stahlbacteria bacterium]